MQCHLGRIVGVHHQQKLYANEITPNSPKTPHQNKLNLKLGKEENGFPTTNNGKAIGPEVPRCGSPSPEDPAPVIPTDMCIQSGMVG